MNKIELPFRDKILESINFVIASIMMTVCYWNYKEFVGLFWIFIMYAYIKEAHERSK